MIQASGNKPLIAEDGTLNDDVPVTCGAQTKFVTTKITAEGEVAAFAVGVPTGPAGWWIGPWPGSVKAVVQQFDEAAILGCAGFSQGDKRQSVVNGLVEQCRAFNREEHAGLDTLVKNRCNAPPGTPHYDIGRMFKVCDKIADSTITCSVQRH
ncbi:MAG TPA: hypothetical protein VK932_12215 [Kofleriaceae bacterium]|nr:hypothetical protein [Kofleriaceae bacterium]